MIGSGWGARAIKGVEDRLLVAEGIAGVRVNAGVQAFTMEVVPPAVLAIGTEGPTKFFR